MIGKRQALIAAEVDAPAQQRVVSSTQEHVNTIQCDKDHSSLIAVRKSHDPVSDRKGCIVGAEGCTDQGRCYRWLHPTRNFMLKAHDMQI